MNKLESFGTGLLPVAIAAGMLSGSFFKPTPAVESSQAPPKPHEATKSAAEDTAGRAWLSDLRPVMETMGDAMGVSIQRDAVSRSVALTAADLGRFQFDQVPNAIVTVQKELQDRLSNSANACVVNEDESLTGAERTLNAFLLSGKGSDSPSGKVQYAVAQETMNALQDLRALTTLTRTSQRATPYDVRFIVATVPDYVDSNSGWLADQSLAAIQSALSRVQFVLDRFKLIDWTRSDASQDNPVVSESQLHEREPGVLIFRRDDIPNLRLELVLLALETPTSGVHRLALRNAIRFIRAWNQCVGASGSSTVLRVLGPSFSGSSQSLALTLGEPGDDFATAFPTIRVISGSATADKNPEVIRRFAPKGTTFSAAVPPTSETRRIMSAYLQRINASWKHGENVAMLLESNTVYGQATQYGKPTDDPFDKASVFHFPLHISQLRNEAVSLPSSVTLLPTPVVPLNMRETTPPSDQIPALRPQLTSSVVESTVDTILDTIRHERLSAVGIQATDDRDVLFLAREVKRAAPDVQLFFLSAHALYLHPDYVPYLRGTLVASPYPLSLATQGHFASASNIREPFQSMVAEAVFNATLLLLNEDSELRDYCDPKRAATQPCLPRVAISVIGEDGFWPLPGVESTEPLAADGSPYMQPLNYANFPAVPDRRFVPYDLPPLPNRAKVVIALLAVFVLAQVCMVLSIVIKLRRRSPEHAFAAGPLGRMLEPPVISESASKLHQFTLAICFVVLALIAAWTTAVVLPFAVSAASGAFTVAATWFVVGIVLVPIALLLSTPKRGVLSNCPEAASVKSSQLLWLTLLPLMVAIVAFAVYLTNLAAQSGSGSDFQLTMARLVGGGIVSPAPATLCLFGGLYVSVFAGARRLSLIGQGYTRLASTSSAFALLKSSNGSRLGDTLDMPSRNLPLSYLGAILFVIVSAAVSVGRISTVDGLPFTWFFAAASATVLTFGLVNLAQGLTVWNTARQHLKVLAVSPIEGAFKSIGHLVPWNLSVAPPQLVALMPVAQRADDIIQTCGPLVLNGNPLDSASQLVKLEAKREPHAPFTLSSTWAHLWNVADAIVEKLNGNGWQQTGAVHQLPASTTRGLPVLLSVTTMPDSNPEDAALRAPIKMAAIIEASPESHSAGALSAPDGADSVRRCKEFLALQFAFVVRDVVARTVSALFTAMLCLTLLTAAHLLYSFNPRSAMLTVDLLAVAAAAVTAMWVLVSMEREPVLSRLRNTTPGHVDISWPFVQRIAMYGVLPLLVVLSSLFPEIGGSLFGWLEPLRKLSVF